MNPSDLIFVLVCAIPPLSLAAIAASVRAGRRLHRWAYGVLGWLGWLASVATVMYLALVFLAFTALAGGPDAVGNEAFALFVLAGIAALVLPCALVIGLRRARPRGSAFEHGAQ